MNFPLFVARKYFLSKKKKNFINVIAIISMLVVAIGTAALVIVLSVFNGLEDLLRSLYGSFDPEVKVEARLGKSFVPTESFIQEIESLKEVEIVTQVIEDNALLKYNEAQMIVRVKGVTDNFLEQKRIEEYIDYGRAVLNDSDNNYAIIGRGIIYALDINIQNQLRPLQLYYPKNVEKLSLKTSNLYTVKAILPGATFAIEKQYDDSYIIVPLSFAKELFTYGNKLNALEIKVAQGYSNKDAKEALQSLLGDDFNIKRNEEIHADLYKILKMEKLIVFIILSLIIGIASVNIYFSLSMLVLDKKRDISMLFVLGATDKIVRRIFILEGVIISFSGALVGLLIGLSVCFGQEYFGIVGMGMESSLISAYPVSVEVMDLLYSVISIIIITLLASVPPAKLATSSFSSADL